MERRRTEATVNVALLGELRIRIDDVELPRLPPKSRALVASLALRCGEVASVDRLTDELWPAMRPDQAKRVVQVRVAEVRKVLSVASAASLLESVAPGYRLAVEPVAVDANRFCELLAAAHRCQSADDSLGATTKLREALGCGVVRRSPTPRAASSSTPRLSDSTTCGSARSRTGSRPSWPMAAISDWSANCGRSWRCTRFASASGRNWRPRCIGASDRPTPCVRARPPAGASPRTSGSSPAPRCRPSRTPCSPTTLH